MDKRRNLIYRKIGPTTEIRMVDYDTLKNWRKPKLLAPLFDTVQGQPGFDKLKEVAEALSGAGKNGGPVVRVLRVKAVDGFVVKKEVNVYDSDGILRTKTSWKPGKDIRFKRIY